MEVNYINVKLSKKDKWLFKVKKIHVGFITYIEAKKYENNSGKDGKMSNGDMVL